MAGIKDILNMDISTFNKLSRSELARVTSQLASAANKRLRRFEESGRTSQAVNYAKGSGGKFSTKGKDLPALRAEFARVRGFLEAKTSSLTGLARVEKETMQTLQKRGADVSKEQAGQLFSLYDKLRESDPAIAEKGLKYRVLQELSQMPESMDPEQKILEMQDRIRELYEEGIEQDEDFEDGVSGYFPGY